MSSLPSALQRLADGSPSLRPLLDAASRGAASSAPILILGEPGTGRTTLARALHAASERQGMPLVEVDPGSIPSSLFESEFFGHEPGAFTGAEERAPGRVARAEGGALLLDHVEETPMPAQAKLLRLLADERYAPLGGEDRQADVRFLAIGSSDLPQRIESGAFRADLYFRLEVLTLRLPPLRERMDDIPTLVRHLLADLSERFGRPHLDLAPAAASWMQSHSWPGNLRELRNVLEREVLMSASQIVDPQPAFGSGGPPESLEEVERQQIVRALRYSRGHQGRAAQVLGISRKSLWEKRRRYGLP